MSVGVLADAPDRIHYQGRMYGDSDEPVNGTYAVSIAVFDAETGGSELYTQRVGNVVFTNGMYDFTWGDVGLSNALTNDYCWMELSVNSTVLSPRQRIISVPYAIRAKTANRMNVPISGMPSSVIMIWNGSVTNIPDGWALCDGANGTPDLRERFVAGADSTPEVGSAVGSSSYTLSESQMPGHTHSGSCSTAGAHTHSGSTASGGSHAHSGSLGSAGAHSHWINKKRSWGSLSGVACGSYPPACTAWNDNNTGSAGSHSHSVTINSAGAHTHTVSVNSAGDHSHTITVNPTGSGAAIDNRPAYYEVAFIMKL